MSVPLDETVRVLHVVETTRDLPAARPDTIVVVLDPAWTPLPDGRTDVLAARSLFGAAVERRDIPAAALERIDSWADRGRAADLLQIDGVTYWFRMREPMWRWLHERLLWRDVLAGIGAGDRAMVYRVPQTEEALSDVAGRLGSVDAVVSLEAAPEQAEPLDRAVRRVDSWGPTRFAGRIVRRLRRLTRASGAGGEIPSRPGSDASDPRVAQLIDRVKRYADSVGPRVVVLTTPATYQPFAGTRGRRDPILGSVVDQLERAGLEPVLMAIGLDSRRDADWEILAADRRMLPGSLLQVRWGRPQDRTRSDRALATIGAAVERLREEPLDIDGLDLTAAFVDALRDRLLDIIYNDVRHQARIERFLAELKPRAILLAQEGIRVPWLVAGREAGMPVFAVQHGILYPNHPGYPHQRHPAVVRAAATFVYGPWERAALLERGAYLPSEVEVSGSPRLDFDGVAMDAATTAAVGGAPADRAAVRAELGVRDVDRLLVVSTVNLPFVQRGHFAPMLERVLGGPLPRVHVVFKLHPGEREDGPYRALLEGLARAGGYEAPPISVVRDIDLYRLLRAADAHLGLHSTVLTDAVAAGTPNLIAMVDAHADILGYVEAGVARPVRDAVDVIHALDTPAPPDPATRAAFLARHFLDGNAGARIARAIAGSVESAVPSSAERRSIGAARQ